MFSVQFFKHLDFSTNTVDNFVAPTIFSASRLAPIPTKERGFYFDTNSSLTSNTHWTLSPDFTLRLTIRVTNCTADSLNCLIFTVNNSQALFTLEVSNTSLISTWFLTNSSGGNENYTLTTDFEFGSWFKIIISASQGEGNVTLSHIYPYIYQYATTSVVLTNKEFNNPYPPQVYGFGNTTNSFMGFLYEAWADNYLIDSYQTSVFLVNCEYNEYYLNPQCLPCNSTCPTWPWCTHAGACTGSNSGSCYSNNCTTCTGFRYSDCTSCANGNVNLATCDCWKFCLTCSSTFQCTSCNPMYTLINGLCIYEPYLWNPASTAPTVSIVFNTIEQYYDGLFQSGHNATTYAPYNSPERDDPIPAASRGLYFNGHNYLKSISKISFSQDNTFLIWALPQGDGFNFWNAPSMLLYSSASASYLLTDSYTWTRFNTYSIANVTTWTLFSFIHSFAAPVTTCQIMLNNATFSTISINGYALYDIKTIIYILGEGFLYSLNAYNKAISSVTNPNLICSSGQTSSCIWNCSLDSYYNGTGCSSCNPSCTAGCVSASSCSLCSNPKCVTCSTINSNSCTSTHSSSNTCVPSWNNGVYNGCCDQSCGTCSGPFAYSCTSCSSGLLLGSLCIQNCPDGYSIERDSCILTDALIVNFTFNEIYGVYVDKTHNIQLHCGANSSLYPDLLPSNPIPADARGLYFLETSYLTSSDIFLSTSFTIVFWLKQKTGGIILQKNSLKVQVIDSNVEVVMTGIANFTIQNYNYDYEWNQFVISVFNNANNRLSALISTLTYKIGTYQGDYLYFIDAGSPITIGDSVSSFTGFIYRFQIYNSNFDITLLLQDTICEPGTSLNCLWDCDLPDFWDGYHCNPCLERCHMGCRANDFCNICADVECYNCHDYISTCDVCKVHSSFQNISQCECNAHYYWDLSVESCVPCNSACVLCTGPSVHDCVSCVDEHCVDCLNFGKNSCITCTDNLVPINGVCSECPDFQYYNYTSRVCQPCVSPCITCKSLNFCESCIDHSLMTVYGKCDCAFGYHFSDGACIRNTFIPLYSISNLNVINIEFTEPLMRDLQISDLNVKVTDTVISITLAKVDQENWKIYLNLNTALESGARVYINITSNLLSTLNSIFVNIPYSALLFPVVTDNEVELAQQAQTLAQSTLGVAVASIFGSSLVMMNPGGFFYFLQALEMYYYCMIYIVNLSPALCAFLNALNPGTILPSVFTFLIQDTSGVPLTGKLFDFGFASNLFLINSGVSISIILIFVALLPICYGLSKVDWLPLRTKMLHYFSSYKYSVISRFFIQMFLEFLLTCSIGIYFTQLSNAIQVVDLIICVMTIVKFI